MARNNLISVMDIGSKQISVFIGTKGVNDIFVVKAKSEIEYEGYQDGEWLDIKNLGSILFKAIKEAQEAAGIIIKKLYLGVPGEFTSVVTKEIITRYPKPHTITPYDLDKLYEEGNIYNKNPNYIAINSAPIFYTLDNQTRLVDPSGMKVKELKGLISFVLCSRLFYKPISEILLKIGIREIEFISSSWAEGMYLFDDDTRDKSVLLADIGYISSTLSYLRGDGILYQRSFSLGAGHIDADLMRVLEIPYDQALALRMKVNLSLQASEYDSYDIFAHGKRDRVAITYVQSIVSARILDIAEIIRDCIEDCEYDCPKYIPIYLTGCGITSINGSKDIIMTTTCRGVELIAPNVPDHSKPDYSSVFGVMYIASRLENKSRGLKKILTRLFRK